jgi:hypothetical protein
MIDKLIFAVGFGPSSGTSTSRPGLSSRICSVSRPKCSTNYSASTDPMPSISPEPKTRRISLDRCREAGCKYGEGDLRGQDGCPSGPQQRVYDLHVPVLLSVTMVGRGRSARPHGRIEEQIAALRV